MNGKIIVVTHKPYKFPTDELYMPIGVGKGIPVLRDKYICDDTGDNISDSNETYCELSAIYWAWKNLDLTTQDYIGVNHYRRYFSVKKRRTDIKNVLKKQELEDIIGDSFKNSVIVTPKRYYLSSIEDHYINSVRGYKEIHRKDITRLKQAVCACAPDYIQETEYVLSHKSAHMLNMFIMSSVNFDAYCSWLFPIINKVVEMSEDRIDRRRYAGALSEFCLDIWIKKNGLTAIEVPLLETERLTFFKKVLIYIRRKLIKAKGTNEVT